MEIPIQNRKIGLNENTFIIAELSANHQQSFDIAVKTIEAAKKAGADAIKLQTYLPDTMTIDCDNEFFRIQEGSLWDGRTYYDLYKEAHTPWEWFPKLQKIAEELGLIFFSTPFDKTAVDFLEELDVPAYKIASFEITDVALIEYIAKKGKPLFISTGIAEKEEITTAVDICKRVGNDNVILLKCTSSYPTDLTDVHLRAIPNMQNTFQTIVGLSDHTLNNSVPIGAVALGACVVEKHFILDRSLGGPDSEFSLEPHEFSNMVQLIRDLEGALGDESLELNEKAKKNRVFSRSLFVVEDVAKGEVFTESNVRSIRPGYGMHPRELKHVLGKKAFSSIKKGTPLKKEHIDNN